MKSHNNIFYLQAHTAKGWGSAALLKMRFLIKRLAIEPCQILELPKEKIKINSDLSETQIDALFDNRLAAQELFEWLTKQNIQIIGYFDYAYPTKLEKNLLDKSPFVFYVKGNLDILQNKAVGFCGSRDASVKGQYVAQMAAKQIAQHHWTVVSGNARGIDTWAHSSALKEQGTTIFVAPEGILPFRIRPESKIYTNQENHLIISEFKPDENWSVRTAMQRNHTICGLSNAMILVQSGLTGGTFEAGNFALRAKIPLFVAEYADSDVSGPGNPYFITQGAEPILKRPNDQSLNLDALFYQVEDHSKKPLYAPQAQSSLFADVPI
jgi:DNA protecting protein DprA